MLLVITDIKARALTEGLGSLGARALRIKARIATLDTQDVETHLDSGADITLMSEEFYLSIPDLPKLKKVYA